MINEYVWISFATGSLNIKCTSLFAMRGLPSSDKIIIVKWWNTDLWSNIIEHIQVQHKPFTWLKCKFGFFSDISYIFLCSRLQ